MKHTRTNLLSKKKIVRIKSQQQQQQQQTMVKTRSAFENYQNMDYNELRKYATALHIQQLKHPNVVQLREAIALHIQQRRPSVSSSTKKKKVKINRSTAAIEIQVQKKQYPQRQRTQTTTNASLTMSNRDYNMTHAKDQSWANKQKMLEKNSGCDTVPPKVLLASLTPSITIFITP